MLYGTYAKSETSGRARMLAYTLLTEYASYTLSHGSYVVTKQDIADAMHDFASEFYLQTMGALCEQFLTLHPERMQEVTVRYVLKVLASELRGKHSVDHGGRVVGECDELANICRSIAATSEAFADEVALAIEAFEYVG